MAAAESSPASTGPRYAPEDPTLPKPWMGLIDGSTGILYYWNPETNITQYEKPASAPPPLPLGPPPVSTPKLAQIPVALSSQPSALVHQNTPQQQHHGQQTGQLSQQPQATQQQLGHENSHLSQQQGHHMPQQQGASHQLVQQGSQLAQGIQQPAQMRAQMLQHPVQQVFPHMGQQMPQQGGQQLPQQPMQQAIQQMSQQGGQHMLHHQSSQMPQQGQQHTYPNYMAYPQNMPPVNQQTSQQFPSQNDYKAPLRKRGEIDIHHGNQTNISPSHFQQSGAPSSQHLPNSVSTSQAGAHGGQPQQFNGPPVNVQQPAAVSHLQQSGTDLVHQQHGPRFHNNTGPPIMHNQHPNVPNTTGRATNELYRTEGPHMLGSGQPNPTGMPMAKHQQELRMGEVPFQNVSQNYAGGFNSAGNAMHNMHNHATGHPPFPNNSIMRPPFIGGSNATNFSPADDYRQKHELTATGDDIPAPFITFEASGFPQEILNDIHNAGFLAPTPIQAQTWPIALQNRDIVAIAKTGSGKTLGYLIPAFILLRQCRNNRQNGPTVLVLAPTRELATQIQDEAIKFGRSSRVSCTCLYGGASKPAQLQELDRGADIVVATPGRLNDILDMKKIDFRQVSLLVLDEADRMLDMGFEPQIRKIVNEIPPKRQTLMFTATWPKEVRRIANDLLVNPVQVNTGCVDELVANQSITQYVELISQMEKDRRLEQILRAQERGSKVIIFCSTKRLCDQLARSVGRQFGAAVIHGDKSQGERDWVLNQFRSGKSPVLVATDVAARGLDIKDIRVVINYDFPTGIEDYVHRIGRTGRAGATGVSYTFFSEQDWKYAPDLIKVLERANQHVPPEIREMALHHGPGLGRDRGGMNRFDSGGRWDSQGRGGMRDGGFGGRGGMRDGGLGGRGGMRDGNFGGRGGFRDGGYGGRGGIRGAPFGGRGGRNDSFSGRGGRSERGRGFGGQAGWSRSERGPHDRYSSMDGRGRGRGRFDGRREMADRNSDRSYSRSPDRVRTWGYSRSRSRSRSLSRSHSRSRSRSRSWSRGDSRSRSPRRSRSYSRSRSRSQSRSYDRFQRPRKSGFDQKDPPVQGFQAPESKMSSASPDAHANANSGAEGQPKDEGAVPEAVHPDASQAPAIESARET